MSILSFLKNWTLPIAIIFGIISYFVAVWLWQVVPANTLPSRKFILDAISIIQPIFIFVMLFVSLLKLKFSELKPSGWELWLLIIQGGSFTILGMLLYLIPDLSCRVLVEAGMLAMICPTATAAAVIVRKLGGSVPHVMSYTILSNFWASFLIPALVPFAHPVEGFSFIKAFTMILTEVLPLLGGPIIAAFLFRKFLPKIADYLNNMHDLAFHLWVLSLTLAIAVSTRAVVHAEVGVWYLIGIALVSFICCILQFALGRLIAGKNGDAITGGQALGQKSTVFMIWTGYTFFSPVSAVTGGFYSIWHNTINSLQLYRARKAEALKHVKN